MSDVAAPPVDPGSLIRSRQYRVLLVFAAMIGVLVSLASWGFLELVYYIQHGVYKDLPSDLGYSTVPWWWPLPWLALAGLLTAVAILRLPGRGGHVPADGLKTGGAPTQPIELPGILLAALATLGLGLVLGPEAPLIALGMGLGALAMRLAKKDAPDQALALMAAAGAFAAISSLFGSPVVGAVIIIEATGLGGATLPVILLPGLLAAGIGSLVFIGMGSVTGLSTSAYALSPLALPAFSNPDFGDFAWTIALAIAAAAVTFVIIELAQWSKRLVAARPLLLTIVAALAVGGLAIAFDQTTGESGRRCALLRPGRLWRTHQDRPDPIPVHARAPAPVQGTRLEPVAGQLPGRPNVSGAVPRRRRRPPGCAPARAVRVAGGRRVDGRRMRIGA